MTAAIILELVKLTVHTYCQYMREKGKSEAEILELFRIVAEEYAKLPPPDNLKDV